MHDCFPLSTLIGLRIPDVILGIILGGSEFSDLLLPLFHRMKKGVLPDVIVHRLMIVKNVDVRKWLPKISIPCCYIQATNDIAVPVSAIEDFRRSIPHLFEKNVDGPHFIIQARSKELAAVISEFYESTKKINVHRAGNST